jgi:hypothetical protein
MLAGLTREAVLAAAYEFERGGPGFTMALYGYGATTELDAVIDGVRIPAKALAGLAHRYQFGGRALAPSEFSGGIDHSAGHLVRLGIEVRRGDERMTVEHLPRRLVLRLRSAPLRLYVCRPTGDRTIEACRAHNFGALLSPISTRSTATRVQITDMSGHSNPIEGLPFVLDNGVWSCHQAAVEWSDEPLLRMIDRFNHRDLKPAFVVAPDIIAAGDESLAFSLDWLRAKRSRCGDLPWLLAVQDGMQVERVREALLEHRLAGIFVGGSTEWKWSTVHAWSELALALGLRVHVGRVNGQRRAQLCSDIGVHSIDGSMVSMFSDKKAGLMAKSCDGLEPMHEPPGPLAIRQAIAERGLRLTLGRDDFARLIRGRAARVSTVDSPDVEQLGLGLDRE